MDLSATTLASAATATKSSTVASLAFLLYDHALTLDAEVEFVWNHGWSFGKALFIFNRYFGPTTLMVNVFVFFNGSVTDKFCENFLWWEGTAVCVAVLSAEIILQARIYAVYERNRRLLIVVTTLFLAEIVGTVIPSLSIDATSFERSFQGLTGCYPLGTPALYFFIWIPLLVFETILCTLMLYKAWRTYKGEYGPNLLNLLIRDSVFYFLTIFVALLVNCVISGLAPQIITEVAMGWAVAVPCSLGSRLLLNMRQQYFREQTVISYDTSQTGIEMHGIRTEDVAGGISFAPPSASTAGA